MRTISSVTAAARAMDRGEMLGLWGGWKGRLMDALPGDSEQTVRFKAQRRLAFERDLQRCFVPAENMVKGVVTNAHDYVLGAEPTWNLTGSDALQFEKVLKAPWNDQALHTECRKVMRTRIRDGEGALRLRIPRGAVKLAQGAVDPVQAGMWLRFEAVTEPERLTIWEDEDSLTPRAEFDLGNDPEGKPLGVEVSYVLPSGKTVLLLRKDGTLSLIWMLDLGGRLPYIQIKGDALVTQGMIDNQAGANLVMTSAINNSEMAGQIMEHFHNMQPQREPDIKNLDGSVTQGAPLPATRGPGGELYTADTVAIQTVEEVGGDRDVPVILKGSYERHGPVTSEPLDYTLKQARYNIYNEAKQGHYLIIDKATATGESRKTAMSSFFKSLAPFRVDAVTLLRELLSTTVVMAYALARQPPPEIHVEPKLTDTLVEPTTEERAQDQSEVKDRIISMETARSRQGILDSSAEQKRIDLEQKLEAEKNPPQPPAPIPSPAQPPVQ